MNPGRSTDPDPKSGEPDAEHDEWALQADAAEIVGCSVSAIRKWRREGVVADRRTTTTGGLERIEVRLRDVIDRSGQEPQRTVASGITEVPAAGPGTASIPFADLQALILSLGDAERRAQEATNRVALTEAEAERLTGSMARSQAELAAAAADAERLRRLVRELQAAAAVDRPPPGDSAENQRLREQLSKLEARMAESRSGVAGQRRRIRELEAQKAVASENAQAAHVERDHVRERARRLESRLTTAKREIDRQTRLIRELEAWPPAPPAVPSEAAAATDAENERLYSQLVKLEAHMAEVAGEASGHLRHIAELEARLASLLGNGLAAEDENERLREQVSRLEARLATAKRELDGQRHRIGQLESKLAEQPTVPPPVPDPPARPSRQSPAAAVPPSALYDDDLETARSSTPAPSDKHPETNGLGTRAQAAQRRSRNRPRTVDDASPALDADGDTATRLRTLYSRLHARPRDEPSSPDDQRRWVADLAAYDQALILACMEFGVPTSFEPGHRIPAEDRVTLTRALREAGLGVATD